jgi:hypothetical protein
MYTWEKLSKWSDFNFILVHVNRWLHSDPISTLVSVSFWSFLLIWVSPLLGKFGKGIKGIYQSISLL